MASGGREIDRRAVLMRYFRASMVRDVEKGEERGGGVRWKMGIYRLQVVQMEESSSKIRITLA